MITEPITDAQRFSRKNDQLCPICSGGSDDPQSEGIRCYGFMSGGTARCTRKEPANGIPLNEDTGTYAHVLNRDCRCGTRHPAPSWWQSSVTTFPYVENDIVLGTHMRRDWPKGPKDMWWTDLNGRAPATLPLYGADVLDLVPPGTIVVVVEGEKKVDMLRAEPFNIAAVGIGTGAPTTHNVDAFKPLLGYTVVLWGDADDKGITQRKATAARLLEIGHRNVRELPDTTPAPDDFIDAGNTIEQVLALLDQATPVRPVEPAAASTSGKTYRATDSGNSERFADQYRHHVRFCPEWKSWVVFDGRVWREDVGGLVVDQMMKASLLTIYDEAKRLDDEEQAKKHRAFAFQCENKGRRSAALELAKSEMPVYAREFDTDKWILNCPNGTLDLRTGDLRKARAEDLCTKLAGCDYDPDATDATWETYIAEKLPDVVTREWTQRLVGYALAGERTEDIMVDLYGPTRGGKTTLGEVAKNLMGDYAAVLQADSFMVSRQDNAPGGNRPDLAMLPGVRLVVSEEAEEHMKLDEGLVKQMTGGASITAAAKFKRPVTFQPEYLWMLIGNHLVRVRDGEEAIWTRIPTIPFNVCVKKQEEKKEIKQYLTTDPRALQAALAWAVRGCLAWQEVGLKPWAPEVLATTAMYRDRMNALADFVEAECDLGVDLKVPAVTLRTRYMRWCTENRVRALTEKEMAARLRDLKCDPAKGTGGLRVWKGIKLKDLGV